MADIAVDVSRRLGRTRGSWPVGCGRAAAAGASPPTFALRRRLPRPPRGLRPRSRPAAGRRSSSQSADEPGDFGRVLGLRARSVGPPTDPPRRRARAQARGRPAERSFGEIRLPPRRARRLRQGALRFRDPNDAVPTSPNNNAVISALASNSGELLSAADRLERDTATEASSQTAPARRELARRRPAQGPRPRPGRPPSRSRSSRARATDGWDVMRWESVALPPRASRRDSTSPPPILHLVVRHARARR